MTASPNGKIVTVQSHNKHILLRTKMRKFLNLFIKYCYQIRPSGFISYLHFAVLPRISFVNILSFTPGTSIKNLQAVLYISFRSTYWQACRLLLLRTSVLDSAYLYIRPKNAGITSAAPTTSTYSPTPCLLRYGQLLWSLYFHLLPPALSPCLPVCIIVRVWD